MPTDRTPDELHCSKCFYHCILDNHVCCEFILVTGKQRGCEFGRKCTRFLRGDPRIRWGMDPEWELEPGVIPGIGDKQPKKTRMHRRVPLDLSAYKELRKTRTAKELGEVTGTSKSLWQNLRKTGTINPTLAQRIFDLYGVDLVKR